MVLTSNFSARSFELPRTNQSKNNTRAIELASFELYILRPDEVPFLVYL
jgi:hypothetical protein